jgi:hypothetical protein
MTTAPGVAVLAGRGRYSPAVVLTCLNANPSVLLPGSTISLAGHRQLPVADSSPGTAQG